MGPKMHSFGFEGKIVAWSGSAMFNVIAIIEADTATMATERSSYSLHPLIRMDMATDANNYFLFDFHTQLPSAVSTTSPLSVSQRNNIKYSSNSDALLADLSDAVFMGPAFSHWIN